MPRQPRLSAHSRHIVWNFSRCGGPVQRSTISGALHDEKKSTVSTWRRGVTGDTLLGCNSGLQSQESGVCDSILFALLVCCGASPQEHHFEPTSTVYKEKSLLLERSVVEKISGFYERSFQAQDSHVGSGYPVQ